ncbi:MAG: gluconate 2-dehydrogenase subunit 3 family protein [Saprospiraceae bacterium]
MDRRTILKYTAYLTGYAVAAPLGSALLSGCKAEPKAPDFNPAFFTGDAWQNLSAMIDTMLPATKTPGAVEVGVPQFIDLLLSVYSLPEDQERIRKGMNEWLASVQTAQGKAYHELDADTQLSLLNELDKTAKTEAEALLELDISAEEATARFPWWLSVKSMAIGGYFSSAKVATEVLVYDPVPGPYQGCIPFSSVGASYSL